MIVASTAAGQLPIQNMPVGDRAVAPASDPAAGTRERASQAPARAPGPALSADPSRRRYGDVRELIANPHNPTPLVRLGRVLPPGMEAHLKLEWFNPFGSIKDRTALYLLEGMRRRGELDGRELVEATSGNTGIALAALAALEGLRLTVGLPPLS